MPRVKATGIGSTKLKGKSPAVSRVDGNMESRVEEKARIVSTF